LFTMLISFWLAILMSFLIAILLIWMTARIAKKMNKQPAGGGVIGFFLGFALVVFAFIGPSRLYVVSGDDEYAHYMVFGTPEYTIDGGATISVEIGSGECFVINETSGDIVIEEIVYGGIFGGDTDWIYPGEGEAVEGGSIHYFFDDEPPDQISVNDGTDEVTKLWLRKRRY
jgi:hypothetical protein